PRLALLRSPHRRLMAADPLPAQGKQLTRPFHGLQRALRRALHSGAEYPSALIQFSFTLIDLLLPPSQRGLPPVSLPFPLIGRAFAVIGCVLALVACVLAVIGCVLAVIGCVLALVGCVLALVGRAFALTGRAFALGHGLTLSWRLVPPLDGCLRAFHAPRMHRSSPDCSQQVQVPSTMASSSVHQTGAGLIARDPVLLASKYWR